MPRRRPQYQLDLAASQLPEDAAVIAALEQQAHEEKERLYQQKYSAVKQRNAAKQEMISEAARLAKANRQLEHDMSMTKIKLEKMQARHSRRMDHVEYSFLRKVDKLARHLERRLHTGRTGGRAYRAEALAAAPPAAPVEVPAAAELEDWLQSEAMEDFLETLSAARTRQRSSSQTRFAADEKMRAAQIPRVSVSMPCMVSG